MRQCPDIFRFTLYWTLVLYTPAFIICGAYAFLNLTFPPRRPLRKGYKTRPPLSDSGPSYRSVSNGERIPLRRYDRRGLGVDISNQSQLRLPSRSPAKQNEKRSRVTFAILVFFLFACFALGGAIVGSAIIGYVVAGLFKAAKYNMSTYVCRYEYCTGVSGPSLRTRSVLGLVHPVHGTEAADLRSRGSQVWLPLHQPSAFFTPLLTICCASTDGFRLSPRYYRRLWDSLREYRTLRLCVIFVSS